MKTIDGMARRVAGFGRTGSTDMAKLVASYEGLGDLLSDLLIAVRGSIETYRKDIPPEAAKLSEEQADVLEAAVNAVLPKIAELDQKVFDAL